MPEALEISVPPHQEKLGVAAADDEADEREFRWGDLALALLSPRAVAEYGTVQPVRVQVPFDVVHGDARQLSRPGSRLRGVDAHQK